MDLETQGRASSWAPPASGAMAISTRSHCGIELPALSDTWSVMVIDARSAAILSARLDRRPDPSCQIWTNLASLAPHNDGNERHDGNDFGCQYGTEPDSTSHNLNDKTRADSRGGAEDDNRAAEGQAHWMDCTWRPHETARNSIEKATRPPFGAQLLAPAAAAPSAADAGSKSETPHRWAKRNCDSGKQNGIIGTSFDAARGASKSETVGSVASLHGHTPASFDAQNEPLRQLAVPITVIQRRPSSLADATSSQKQRAVVSVAGSVSLRTTAMREATRAWPHNIRDSTTKMIDWPRAPRGRYYRQVDRDGADLPDALALCNPSWPHSGGQLAEPQNNEPFGRASGRQLDRQQQQRRRRRWRRPRSGPSSRSMEEEEVDVVVPQVGVCPGSIGLCNVGGGDVDDDRKDNDDERKMNPRQAIRVANRAGGCRDIATSTSTSGGGRGGGEMGTYNTAVGAVVAVAIAESLQVQIDRSRRLQRQLVACRELRHHAPSEPSSVLRHQLSSSGVGASAFCVSCPPAQVRVLLAADTTNMGPTCEATRLEPVPKCAIVRARLPVARSRTPGHFWSAYAQGSGRLRPFIAATVSGPASPLETKARNKLTSGSRRWACCPLDRIVMTKTSVYNQNVVNQRVGALNRSGQYRVSASERTALGAHEEAIVRTGSTCLLSSCCFLLLEIIMQTTDNWTLRPVMLLLLLLLLLATVVIATCRPLPIILLFISQQQRPQPATLDCGESNGRRCQCCTKSQLPTSLKRRDKLNQTTTRAPGVECDQSSCGACLDSCMPMMPVTLSGSSLTIGWPQKRLTSSSNSVTICVMERLKSSPPISRLSSGPLNNSSHNNDNSSDNQFIAAAEAVGRQEVRPRQCQRRRGTFRGEEAVTKRRKRRDLLERKSEFGQSLALLTVVLVVSLVAGARGTTATSAHRYRPGFERQLFDLILFRRPPLDEKAAATAAGKPNIHSQQQQQPLQQQQQQWHFINESSSVPVARRFEPDEGDDKEHRRRRLATIIDYGHWQAREGVAGGQDLVKLAANNLSPPAPPLEREAATLAVQPNESGPTNCHSRAGHRDHNRASLAGENNQEPHGGQRRMRATGHNGPPSWRSSSVTSRVKRTKSNDNNSGNNNNHKSPVTVQQATGLSASGHHATRRGDARDAHLTVVDRNKNINYQPPSPPIGQWRRSFTNNKNNNNYYNYNDDDDNGDIRDKTLSRGERKVVKVASSRRAAEHDSGNKGAKMAKTSSGARRSRPPLAVSSYGDDAGPRLRQVHFSWCFVYNSISRNGSVAPLCDQHQANGAAYDELDHNRGRRHTQPGVAVATTTTTTVTRSSWLAYCSINIVVDVGEMAPDSHETDLDDVICCCARPAVDQAHETMGRRSVGGISGGQWEETLHGVDTTEEDNTFHKNETSDIESVIDELNSATRSPDNSNAALVSTGIESSFSDTTVGSHTNRSALNELLPSAASFKWTQYQEDDETAAVNNNFNSFKEDFSNTNFIPSEGNQQLDTISLAAAPTAEAVATTTTSSSSILTYDNRPSVISHIGTQHDSISITSAISEYIGDMIDKGHLLLLGLSLIILVTFFGNVLVCLSVIKVRKLRQPSNYLLVSLAISDLCVACVVMPFGVYQSINDNWQLGTLLCNVYVVSDITSCTASILNLCVISIDRYFAITRPLTYCIKRTARLMLMLIAFVWILACLISVPPLLISGNEYGTVDEPRCEVSQSVWYQLYATLFSFYIPLCVMIFIYYNIYTAAKKVIKAEQRATTGLQVNNTLNHQNNINDNSNNNNNSNSNTINNNLSINYQNNININTDSAVSSINNMPSVATKTSSVMKERKASITLGFIMSAFTVCWLPFFIMAIMRPFSPTVNNLPRAFVLLALWLGYANSLLNPIIYVTFHHDFRNAFKHLLCFRCMTINEHIRKDEYKSQYGETHYQENIRKLRGQQYMLPQNQQQHQFNQNQPHENQHQEQLLSKKN